MNFGASTYREAHDAIKAIDASLVSVDALCALLDDAPALIAQYPEFSVVKTRDSSITWFRYENLVWAIGEKLRQAMKARRGIRKDPQLWRRVVSLSRETRLGKGRESLTMLLGQYGGPQFVPVLLPLLDDADVAGHALYALRLLGAPDAIARAKEMVVSARPWIQREAKKYLAKVEGRDSGRVVT